MKNLMKFWIIMVLLFMMALMIGTVIVNLLYPDTDIKVAVTLNWLCVAFVSTFVLAGIFSVISLLVGFLKSSIHHMMDMADAKTIYNMLRNRVYQDTGFIMPQYEDLNSYDFGRGSPLKFVAKDTNWFDHYDRYKGQIMNYYSEGESIDIYSLRCSA